MDKEAGFSVTSSSQYSTLASDGLRIHHIRLIVSQYMEREEKFSSNDHAHKRRQ